MNETRNKPLVRHWIEGGKSEWSDDPINGYVYVSEGAKPEPTVEHNLHIIAADDGAFVCDVGNTGIKTRDLNEAERFLMDFAIGEGYDVSRVLAAHAVNAAPETRRYGRKPTEAEIAEAVEAALNVACRHLQDIMGVDSGDLAAQFFCNYEDTHPWARNLRSTLRNYIAAEMTGLPMRHEVSEDELLAMYEKQIGIENRNAARRLYEDRNAANGRTFIYEIDTEV